MLRTREFSQTFLFFTLLANKSTMENIERVWAVFKVEHNTVILRKNARTGIGPILPLGHLLIMLRDYRPIIIILAHPGNRGGSSYLLASAA